MKHTLAIALALIACLLAGCGGAPSLVGAWESSETGVQAVQITLVLNKDRSGTLLMKGRDGASRRQEFTWEEKETSLILREPVKGEPWETKIMSKDKNGLVLDFGKGLGAFTFVRVGNK